jgi:predicted extracellular nuclease
MTRALGIAVIALLAWLGLARPGLAASPDVVVSEVYGGGGNAGATLRNDFVELFNRGSAPVSLDGWSVQYASATGTSWQITPLGGTIEPGGHYLVQEAAGTGGTQDLPAPDATGGIAMSATASKVALVTAAAGLTCGASPGSCSSDSLVRDMIGYGGASDFEGGPAPGLSNTTAARRRAGGCQDTDSNAADFEAGSPDPLNSAAAPAPCPGDAAPAVTATDPSAGQGDVAVDADIEITFSEPLAAASGAFSVECSGSGTHGLTVSGGPTTFVLDPDGELSRAETCTVTVSAAAVSDEDVDDPPDGMAGDFAFSFTTVGLAIRIHEIQGAAHISPYEGAVVSSVPGVVTAVSSNGFYMQDPAPDRDSRTSEGIFVFTGSAPPAIAAIGNLVGVSGRVQEFRPGCFPSCDPASSGFDNLTTTEIVGPTVSAAGTGEVVPAVLGPGGRTPPMAVIDDDSAGNVEGNPVFDPLRDGIDFHESLEGMLVRIDRAVAVGPTNDFGEVPVLAQGGAGAGLRSARGGIVVAPFDFNPERLMLDDVLAPTRPVDVGDRLTGAVEAVVDYSFGNFKYLVLDEPRVTDGGLEPERAQRPDGDELAVGSLNVENLDPTDPAAKFERLAEQVVENLRSPDLLGIEEVQDNTGPAPDPSTDASVTWETLIAAIEAAGGPAYDYRQIDPAANQDGGEPGGNIRVGFLFRTDRGLTFVDRPGGTSTAATREDPTRRGAQLTLSPGRIEPQDPAFANSRKPLAGEFRWRGRTLFVIANHFNSKGGDDPLFGRFQPPQRQTEAQRHAQATIVNRFVETLLDAERDARVIVLGDLNDFEFSETLDILAGRELFNLIETLPRRERYSYVFEGNSQVLDQILVSRSLLRSSPEYDSVHINSEFADQVSDHDPQLARLELRGGGHDDDHHDDHDREDDDD